ncbi:MAG: CHASE2 domain-containing protein, partial [Deltaproteobacteria bacterium]|nr:CHASE2 domain-containing protein [Deltaproteobacteria bacterium]
LAFNLRDGLEDNKEDAGRKDVIEYLEHTKWRVDHEGELDRFYVGRDPLVTFTALAKATKGLGSLSVKMDRDGVLRRIPLLVRYGDGFYPTLAFRVICDYLGVGPEDMHIHPGKQILLKGATRPGKSQGHDIAVPIDRHGNMIINFAGPWGRMDHYDFAHILAASENPHELAMWRGRQDCGYFRCRHRLRRHRSGADRQKFSFKRFSRQHHEQHSQRILFAGTDHSGNIIS